VDPRSPNWASEAIRGLDAALKKGQAPVVRVYGASAIEGAAVPSDSSVLDEATLDGLRALRGKHGDDLLREVVETYADSSQKLIDELESAVADQRADAVARASHALKSSSGTVGALGIFELCKSLELAARAGDLTHAANQLDAIRAAQPRVLNALREALL
jgi:HPt (histidine-containing phosphotransfer) domain-containing protein